MTSPPTASFDLSPRSGARPRTTHQTPHLQLDQHSPPDIQAELVRRMATLDGTTTGRSGISAPTPLALHLDADLARGPDNAYLVGTEFAHFHGDGSGSVPMTFPLVVARAAIERQWAEMHPAARMGHAPKTLVMVYGPRDDAELTVAWELVGRSYDYARGL